MPSTDPKPELTAKASMAQPVSQPAVYANGLKPVGGETCGWKRSKLADLLVNKLTKFYVRVTVRRIKFLYNKTN
jgi:hypothetical protein